MNTNHRFEVIRLWEVPAAELLKYKGLFPLASLGKSENRLETLHYAYSSANFKTLPQK
ncbi:hypothetical protein [Gloeocapsa sp. PCC 73106]|uniref:hypothetical protein n=1 Tax=Gloeocapsa sp. PCC 73106 TaxID=102232 RepID=UPI0002AC0EC6|nr:hypothetical protein [Gloeocapsa sp. PCC 73106]ELR98597.1 hypothetical protein GLO73106DRAFT_00024330 [Gloeocapsa sp. PCC 73106]